MLEAARACLTCVVEAGKSASVNKPFGWRVGSRCESGAVPPLSSERRSPDESVVSHSGRPGKAEPSRTSESQDTPSPRDPRRLHGRWGVGQRHPPLAHTFACGGVVLIGTGDGPERSK
jgi:hypothetical protein